MDLIQYLRNKGYRRIKIVEATEDMLKMVVDGWIVDVERKNNLVLVRAYIVNPKLACDVWRFFAIP